MAAAFRPQSDADVNLLPGATATAGRILAPRNYG